MRILICLWTLTLLAALAWAEGDYIYTYGQRSGRFTGPAFNGGIIDVVGCSGQAGSCRNNPAKQCVKSCGPLPQGQYRIGPMQVFKGMQNCYALTQISGDACGRNGFLIHGGSCSANPSEGCIVISDPNVRYKIKGGGLLNVVETHMDMNFTKFAMNTTVVEEKNTTLVV